MAVTIDNGESNDIHPRNKKETGYRLSLIARALAYGEAIEYMGPIYKGMTIKNGRAIIEFTHIGDGLMVKGDQLKGFKLSGPDNVFEEAEAVVEGNRVVVYSEKSPIPWLFDMPTKASRKRIFTIKTDCLQARFDQTGNNKSFL
jgi:sialate O-acetylesterase